MKCPHCNKDIADRLVLSQAAAISNRRSRRSLQRGHSKTDKRTNFGEQGVKRVVEAEALLASMYCGPHERPYDVLAATYRKFEHMDQVLRDCATSQNTIYRVASELWADIAEANTSVTGGDAEGITDDE